MQQMADPLLMCCDDSSSAGEKKKLLQLLNLVLPSLTALGIAAELNWSMKATFNMELRKRTKSAD